MLLILMLLAVSLISSWQNYFNMQGREIQLPGASVGCKKFLGFVG